MRKILGLAALGLVVALPALADSCNNYGGGWYCVVRDGAAYTTVSGLTAGCCVTTASGGDSTSFETKHEWKTRGAGELELTKTGYVIRYNAGSMTFELFWHDKPVVGEPGGDLQTVERHGVSRAKDIEAAGMVP